MNKKVTLATLIAALVFATNGIATAQGQIHLGGCGWLGGYYHFNFHSGVIITPEIKVATADIKLTDAKQAAADEMAALDRASKESAAAKEAADLAHQEAEKASAEALAAAQKARKAETADSDADARSQRADSPSSTCVPGENKAAGNISGPSLVQGCPATPGAELSREKGEQLQADAKELRNFGQFLKDLGWGAFNIGSACYGGALVGAASNLLSTVQMEAGLGAL